MAQRGWVLNCGSNRVSYRLADKLVPCPDASGHAGAAMPLTSVSCVLPENKLCHLGDEGDVWGNHTEVSDLLLILKYHIKMVLCYNGCSK